MQRNQRKQRPSKSAKPSVEMIPHPPALNNRNLVFSTTLRFRATAAFFNSITFANLLDTMLVATTTVNGVDLFQAVKVKRVSIWGMPAIGSSATVSLEYAGTAAGFVGDQIIHTDTSMGVQPAHVSAAPGKRSLAAFFQVSSANTAMAIAGPAGSVIDVQCVFKSQFINANGSAAQALVAATVGTQYLRGLDGLATASSNFVPDYNQAQI